MILSSMFVLGMGLVFGQNIESIAKKAAVDAGLRLDVFAPQPSAPSMTMAIENFLKANK